MQPLDDTVSQPRVGVNIKLGATNQPRGKPPVAPLLQEGEIEGRLLRTVSCIITTLFPPSLTMEPQAK